MTRDSAGAHLTREARSGAIAHGQHQSSPQPGGEVQRHRTCVSAGAHLSREAMSEVIEHVVAPDPTSAGRRGLEP
jgi:hypothetical protein